MTLAYPKGKSPAVYFLLKRFYLFIIAVSFFIQQAKATVWPVGASVNLIDGSGGIYNGIKPGDTVFLLAGNRDKLLIRNCKGNIAKPILFINKDGIVNISTGSYYGISILNCKYIRCSGQGNNSDMYGIQISRVDGGSGIGIGGMSSDIEIDHLQIANCLTEGIFAKTDPDCSFKASRDSFTQFNTIIHDNYITDVANEGMYIGSSYYSGITLTCNGKDTVVMPPLLKGVKVYNNIVKNTGWDGIQVSSASMNCQIFNNTVLNDSQAEVQNQMSGILIGGGTKGDCFNNFICNGKGDGIENHGAGGNKIYNNIIVNAGKTYLPDDLSKMKHGIFISDASVTADSSFYIFFNDIINPKSDGIRFQSIKSRHNLVASNLIINPGNFNLYELDNTPFTGNDAYVMVPNSAADVQLKNNFFSKDAQTAGISENDYTILSGSPLINRGYSDSRSVTFDFQNNRRPVGGLFDIGAMEYNSGNDTLLQTFSEKPVLYPNPVNSTLTIKYLSIELTKTCFNIYSMSGALVMQQYNQVVLPGIQQLQIAVDKLSCGVYFYAMQNGKDIRFGKFIKL